MSEAALVLIPIGVGLTMVAFGLSQIIKPVAWLDYIPKIAEKLIPKSYERTFMRIHGMGNLGLGLLFALGIGLAVVSWITAAWWLTILPFAFLYDWRDGFRDLTIITAIVAVALMVT